MDWGKDGLAMASQGTCGCFGLPCARCEALKASYTPSDGPPSSVVTKGGRHSCGQATAAVKKTGIVFRCTVC